MSARGARSRKVQQKDIEKKEKKAGKNKVVETIHEPHDGFANWRTTPSSNGTRPGLSRSMTMSSGASRTTSQSSGTNDGRNQLRLNAPQTSDSLEISATSRSQRGASSATSTSDTSTKAKEKTKFHAKGKDTRAPRGRGGGVPVKKPTGGPSTNVRSESVASYPPDRKTWQDFKVWDGNKQGVIPYGGFEFDEDMQSGSVLIYFKEEQFDEEHPMPSIRAELQVLRESGSSWLNSVLEYGCLDEDDNDWTLPSNSESSRPSNGRTASGSQPARRMLGPTSLSGRSPPPFDIDQPYDGMSSRAPSSLDRLSRVEPALYPNSPIPQTRSAYSNPTHEIWFTAPNHITNPQEERLYHVAVRNFLALLHGKTIVGADLFDMLNTLQPEIETRYDMDSRGALSVTPRERSVQMITNYLGQHGIDDVRTSIKSAMCILAWAEQDNVRWRQGYLETFVHLAGVMIPELEEVKEFKRLSVVTRRNLGLAAKTLKLRVMEAEEKLSNFDFDDMWEESTKISNSAAYNSYRAFRQFLVDHYTRSYGHWPLATNKTWLNRKIVLALQEDFGSLYDYLVNRDVVWNPREERASRKWEMAHRKNHDFKADVPELGVTDILVRYDARNGFAHIPHPYPLLPRDLPQVPKEKEKKSLFSSLKKDKSKDVAKDAKAHLQLPILFSDATNIEKLDVNFNGSTLIDKFEQFELTTDLKSATPREARLGRWVLLYGILQVLSTLSVDVQGLKHKDGVRYFLCTDLKRCPEWVTNGQVEYLEANQQRSWCWQRSWDPSPTQTAPVELEAVSSSELFTELEHDSRQHGYATAEIHQPRETSPPTSSSDTVALQNDIRRIGEKIDNFSLPHPQPAIEYERRRRENEKAIAADFHNFKPRLDSLPLHQPHAPHPTPANLAHVPHHRRQHAQETFFLADQDEQTLPAPPPPPRSHMRQTIDSVNTDLGGYPFSPAEIQWPVPRGYGGTTNHRESGIGYSTGSWEGYGDGQVVRDGYREVRPRDGETRSPRRMHERNGWA